MRKYLMILAMAAVAAFGTFEFFKVPPRPQIPRYNVLWINSDSFNKRHIPIYGYRRNTMPFLANLSKDGAIFNRMINPSGWTNENLVSLFSSLSSPVHKVECRMRNIDPKWVTPLEILTGYGYRAPRLQGWQMDRNHSELGFEEELQAMHPAEWLEQHGREGPFFLFHQFLQPHLPYNGDARDSDRFFTFFNPTMFKNEASRRRVMTTVFKNTVILNNGKLHFMPEDSEPISALYDGELLLLDHEIEKTVQALERLGLRENTVIVISADHGEEVLEHGFVGHASTSRNGHLYDEIVNVPFVIIFPPRIAGGKFIRTQVRGIDVMPTLLDLLEIPIPDYLEGKSLMPVLRGQESADRIAYVQSSRAGYGEPDPVNVTDHLRAVSDGAWKLIHFYFKENPTRFELYHISEDPYEQKNLINSNPQKANELRKLLLDWIVKEDRVVPPPTELYSGGGTFPLPKSMYQRLRDYFAKKKMRTDFTGVPSPPVILTPSPQAVISGMTDSGRATIRWTGVSDVAYVIGYDVGERDYHLTGEIETDGSEKVFGPFPVKYWNTYLTLYSPYKVRVSINKQPREWSAWVPFEIKAVSEAEP